MNRKRGFVLFAVLFILIPSCSPPASYVIVGETEFGKWQKEVKDIKEELDSIKEPDWEFIPNPTYAYNFLQVNAMLRKIEELQDRIDKLEYKLEHNFMLSEDLPNRHLPSRYQ